MPSRYVQPLRILIQICFLGFMLWLGVRFYLFVQYIRSNGAALFVPRPEGIEGFLPISGLMGIAAWLKGAGINPVHPAAVVILLTVLLISFLLRRSFCSWICPVASVSELLWKSGFNLLKRNPRLPVYLDIPMRGIKYLLLLFFVYGIFIAMSLPELMRFIFSRDHAVADVSLLDFFLHISPLALGVILSLLLLSLFMRNPFCRYLCPYGALLGITAILSPVRVTRNAERCVSCGICSQVCPTSIDVMQMKSVSSPECIGCWRCVSHCRFNEALSMRIFGKYNMPGVLFALLVVLLFCGGTQLGKITGNWQTMLGTTDYMRLLGR